MPEVVTLFDATLPPLMVDDQAFLDLKAEQIRAVAANAVVEIGRHLIEAKERVGHGQFLAWIEGEFKWKERAAENYMAVARAFPHHGADLNISHRALYLLAGPSVPDEMRQAAIDRAEAGERITKEEAEAMIAERSRKVIEDTVAAFKAKQKQEIDTAVEAATDDMFGALKADLDEAKKALRESERTRREALDVEGLCKAIEQNLKIKRMSPNQYRLLAQLLGQRIAVGKHGYDPVPEETLKQNEKNLHITSVITEALQALAGAPPPETLVAIAYPVQLSLHLRVCRQVITWLEQYAEILEEKGDINA